MMWTQIRLRLWNDPYSETGEPYGAGCNDLAETIAIGKKVSDAGFGVLLNFHYSDFWADPGKQIKPKAWKDFDADTSWNRQFMSLPRILCAKYWKPVSM